MGCFRVAVITLLTDFGSDDPYVGCMKGVILSINPNARIIDITHGVPKHNIYIAGFILRTAYRYFPKDSIHVVVVDPGVGGSRKPIIIKSKNYYFIGPDNGVLTLAASDDGIESVYEINLKSKYFAGKEISYTFHGRDIFAPAAAYLSLGVDPSELGIKSNITKAIEFEESRIDKSGRIRSKVVYVDSFGNIVLNVPARYIRDGLMEFGRYYNVYVSNKVVKARLSRSYEEVGIGEPLLIPDSFNLIELAVNRGSASSKFKVSIGDEIIIEL